jgi:hypothetical protein
LGGWDQSSLSTPATETPAVQPSVAASVPVPSQEVPVLEDLEPMRPNSTCTTARPGIDENSTGTSARPGIDYLKLIEVPAACPPEHNLPKSSARVVTQEALVSVRGLKSRVQSTVQHSQLKDILSEGMLEEEACINKGGQGSVEA